MEVTVDIPRTTPLIALIADSSEFDSETINNWRDEGFQVLHLPFNGDRKALYSQLYDVSDSLERRCTYAIIGETFTVDRDILLCSDNSREQQLLETLQE